VRVLVTGGRTFNDRNWLWAGLDLLHREVRPITEIIEGGATGADVRAGEWARARGIPCTVMPAQWELHGRSAGIIRNIEMAELKPDLVLVCPGGKGTAHMQETAQKRGLKIALLEKMPVLPTKEKVLIPLTQIDEMQRDIDSKLRKGMKFTPAGPSGW
jgi:hypothetical protein